MRPAPELHCRSTLPAAAQPPVSHAELLVAVERIAHIWQKRAESEAAIWASFKARLELTDDCDEALQAYSDFSWQRMQAATDDVRRLFEEYREMLARFPATKPRLLPHGLFA
jgi:hypothetical protein